MSTSPRPWKLRIRFRDLLALIFTFGIGALILLDARSTIQLDDLFKGAFVAWIGVLVAWYWREKEKGTAEAK